MHKAIFILILCQFNFYANNKTGGQPLLKPSDTIQTTIKVKYPDTSYTVIDTNRSYKAVQHIYFNNEGNWLKDFLPLFVAFLLIGANYWLVKRQIDTQNNNIQRQINNQDKNVQRQIENQNTIVGKQIDIQRTLFQDQVDNQNIIVQKQSFESSFFNMLKNQQNILNDITDGNIKGQEFLRMVEVEIRDLYNYILHQKYNPNENPDVTPMFHKLFNKNFLQEIGQYDDDLDDFPNGLIYVEKSYALNDVDRVLEAYKIIFLNYSGQLAYYFRHLYHILKYIKSNEVDEITKDKSHENEIKDRYKNYADLLQASLSKTELFITFLNGLNFPKAYDLYQHYNFMENLPIDALLKPDHVKLYPQISFKSLKTNFIML